ncbi:MAG: leucine-rich repeat domain-containing protein, partial [Cuspidothrix sp.]
MTQEELLQVIEQAAREGVTELDLSGKNLTTLPPEIVKLVNLQSLYLWNNQLSSLPPEIVKLVNLQSLDLSSNQLSSLPPEIVKL